MIEEKTPSQMELPGVGNSPKTVNLSAVSFSTLVAYRSAILRDCVITTRYLGPCCTFTIIPPNIRARQEIVDFITAAKTSYRAKPKEMKHEG